MIQRKSVLGLAGLLFLAGGCALHIHYHTGEKHYESKHESIHESIQERGHDPTTEITEAQDTADEIVEGLVGPSRPR